ncbi:hypothetical protein Pcinc_037830 [Petrolisthes cinctipes]|uniref:Uncharacterized protein n=1 Tax=Petrolisthes cinctipes TaxID=88211 RepID=A0AAE1BQT3_PETCI|nr:hypothetical protein Pcinc_040167 [Petrolisthes cinctipes]KAK3855790.1 hypothetical protein Pcinc_037830 [Petrolisthes cinctipes]
MGTSQCYVGGHCKSSVLPPLLLMLLLLLLTVEVQVSEGDGMVERHTDTYGYTYIIFGYALADQLDYQLVSATGACECRRWCQVSTKCHSVSVVKMAGVGVECRVSNRPVDLTDINDRPRLNKTHQAMHFLSAASWSNGDVKEGQVEVMGRVYYLTDTTHQWGQKPRECDVAVLRSPQVTQRLLYYLPASTPINVDLSRYSEGVLPTWNIEKDPLNFIDTDHSISSLVYDIADYHQKYFHLYHNTEVGYTFVGSDGKEKERTLCEKNPFNLID